MNKRKKKSMGNCISKIIKDHLFAYEGLVKNDVLFSKGMTRRGLEMGTRYGTHMGAHYLLRFPEIITLAPLQTGCGGETFKTGYMYK